MKILTIFGTRPETIKLAPILIELEKHSDNVVSKVCITSQHREMLIPFLKLFNIQPDYDLDIMKQNQTLFDITSNVLLELKKVLEKEKPDIILVQGDTTTALAASLAAFYLKTKIGHVEAGLRSGNKYNPFPEEINRRLVDHLADFYFAPTNNAKECLTKEGIEESAIFVTGNTVIDALFLTLGQESRATNQQALIDSQLSTNGPRLILVTAHRRESFGEGLENICQALLRIAEGTNNVEIIYPVHLNPKVQHPVNQLLGNSDRIHLIKPLDYVSFVKLMNKAYLILTDSGGIQEEAPSLGKPVLVMRNTTERPEVIEAGAAKLVSTSPDSIAQATLRLLNDKGEYRKMAQIPNPYGDGHAAEKIVRILMEVL